MSGGAVGVAPTATSSSLHLAALVLEREPTTAAATPQEELARSSARLGELIAELEATRRGDPGAAAHVAEIFEEISDRVLAGDSDPIFA